VLIKQAADIRSREITPRDLYVRRREFLKAAGLTAAGVLAGAFEPDAAVAAVPGEKLTVAKRLVTTTEALTPQTAVTSYGNFWEFGSDKSDPPKNAGAFKPKPWSVAVEGLCARPGTYTLEDILKPHALEERIYRMRCVEGWSMVIPWVGFPLADLIARFKPTSAAKYVAFTTVERPREMPGQNDAVLDWPYREGLRMDEAMNPLALLAFGMYGEVMPNQNGAPVRAVVPWKYGFKSGKSIVKIRFVEKEPGTAWNKAARNEYGFYSNVNPNVDHPRWSQATERRIGEDNIFAKKRPTLMFNGYEAQVGQLYAGMDLKKFY